MTVTATFRPSTLTSEAGRSASLTLELHNDAPEPAVLQVTAVGELAKNTMVETENVHLGPGESFDVPVVVELTTTMPTGPHTSGVEVLTGLGDVVGAEMTINVEQPAQAPSEYRIGLAPQRSTGGRNGKHQLIVENTGSTPVMIEATATPATDAATIELAAPLINVDPGKDARIEVRVHPRSTYWNGGVQEHPFVVTVTGDDHRTQTLDGVFEQGPRLRPWLVPAAVGALGGLILSGIAWFALARPATESIADDRAELAIVEQQEVFDAKVAELEAAAELARQLPLGAPADLRLNVEAEPGAAATESYTVATDRVLSVTDVVFQNPDGAVGRVALLRSGEVLLESELANFRDLDLHFVAPFRFDGSDTVEIRIECETPGPSEAACTAGVSVIGFVDQSR